MSEYKHLSCFVIMPFGEKADTDGKLINFDVIYRYIILEAVTGLKQTDRLDIKCRRCDNIEEAGSIRTDMFDSILEADVAVVDITSMNPNVFYELGVRHALRECVTILIRRKVSKLPFNIQGLRAINYDPSDIDSFDAAKQEIQNFIRNGLKNKKIDSPVREVLPDVKITFPTARLRDGDIYRWKVKTSSEKMLGLVTGDMKRLHGIADIWVNSENTHMQMARYHDKSVSGLIRYLGAKKDKAQQVQDDLIGKALEKELGWGGAIRTVPPGYVVATGSGQLARTPYRVKRIFHAAAVRGIPGGGYQPVPNIDECVWQALGRAKEENVQRSKTSGGKKRWLDSILFPVFGTGTAQGNFKKSAEQMIHAALNYFENNGSDLDLGVAYFLAYDRGQLTTGLDIMNDLVREARLETLPRETTEPATAQERTAAD
jgi:O-acetyl-ADP-ribose deacetylase (regulator of RNase III)